MATQRAPKQWSLTKVEDVNSFESWKENLKYTLSLDANFAPFLVGGFQWNKVSKTDPNRGLISDPPSTVINRKTAEQKVIQLNLMLGQIANYCPVITRNTIIGKSTSIDSIWQSIRAHFGFQSSGGHFLDLADMKLEHGERPEDLYQRLMAFVEDNMLTTTCGIKHNDETLDEDEELTPTVENVIVLLWLKLTHPELPRLVKQRYGTELRSRTLASIKPEISQALESLLDELTHNEEARIMRSSGNNHRTSNRPKHGRDTQKRSTKPVCCLCEQAGRREINHFLSTCTFLPDRERRFMTRARLIGAIEDNASSDHSDSENVFEEEGKSSICRCVEGSKTDGDPSARRVKVKKSPFLNLFYKHYPVRVTIDTGAETNMIREAFAIYLKAKISGNSQLATQADGKSPLHIVGETQLEFVRGKHTFVLEALVVKELDVDILAGVPFTDLNDITIRTKLRQLILSDGTTITYNHDQPKKSYPSVRLITSHILRVQTKTTVWPGEFLELDAPLTVNEDSDVALEPRYDMCDNHNIAWPVPAITSTVEGKIRIPNHTSEPIVLRRNDHVAQISHAYEPTEATTTAKVKSVSFAPSTKAEATLSDTTAKEKPLTFRPSKAVMHSSLIPIDPDGILEANVVDRFKEIHKRYDHVFDPSFPGYNGSAGKIQGIVNIGPVQPPQRKGRLPQYSRNRLVELQEKFDELESAGVFVKPDEADVVVEYLNPSFLVKKGSGKGFRLVTAFNEVGSYAKPQPSLMPDVDSTLRKLASWKYLIKTDLTSAFYQIPLQKESMKYCGVVTPYKGVRVYARCAMGMPGSETALEELMSRILGDLLQEGIIVKIADDLYCGGDTGLDLALNWERLLHELDKANLRLSAPKTLIGPLTAIVLGWIWSLGTIRASSHRITALSTCDSPPTVKGLRSFLGAVKVLARVIPKCSEYLSPLEEIVAGRQSGEKIVWSEELLSLFEKAKKCLSSSKTITLPRCSDTLWIVTDGAVKDHGLGATLYVTREKDKPQLAGYFSAKLRKRQVDWSPCELEALCIASSVNHFSPYIVQSDKQAHVVTDSKPCVQAYQKLNRGEFSTSSRVTTFMSVVSRYQVSVRHLSGSANTPSDFTCRNASPCTEPNCQICSFIAELEDCVVRKLSVHDIMSGSVKIPFFSRSAWKETQSEDSDLRRTHAHLTQGTRPSKKATNIRDVKRYLQVATVARDGLLVVRKEEAFKPPRECIVIPRNAFPGLITALHIRLSHPTAHQLKQVVRRFFFALDLDRQIDELNDHCHLCLSLKSFPTANIEQSTTEAPESVGCTFAADVIRQNKQYILVLRECVTSFTAAKIIPDENHTTLRSGLVELCLPMRPYEGPPAKIRVDPAPGFKSLRNDEQLLQLKLSIDMGREKNRNKNPVAEKAVQEVEVELLKQNPSGGPVSSLALAIAVNCLNSRIRSRGLSAYEMWSQRNQFNNHQINVSDKELIDLQHKEREANHLPSAKAKAPLRKPRPKAGIVIGDIVYLYGDRSKLKARERYIVVSVDKGSCMIRKFTDSQFRSPAYSVRLDECYLVPSEFNPVTMSNLNRYRQDDQDSDYNEVEEHLTSIETQHGPIPSPLQVEVPCQPEIPSEITEPPVNTMDIVNTSQVPDVIEDIPSNIQAPIETLRRSARERKKPPHLSDYELT